MNNNTDEIAFKLESIHSSLVSIRNVLENKGLKLPAQLSKWADELEHSNISESIIHVAPSSTTEDHNTTAPVVLDISDYAYSSIGGSAGRWPQYWPIEKVEGGENVTSLGSYAFRGCSSLKDISSFYNVTSIGSYAFNDCSSLEDVSSLTKVTSIDGYAFNSCSSLKDVSSLTKVTSIGFRALSGCSSLEAIPSFYNVTSIGSYAFSSCSLLKDISSFYNVTSIDSYAFSGCSSLKDISSLTNVTSIGRGAFSDCKSLEDATVFGTVEQPFPPRVFSECTKLEKVSTGAPSLGNYSSTENNSPFYGISLSLKEIHLTSQYVVALDPAPASGSLPKCFEYGSLSNANVIVPNSQISNYTSHAHWSEMRSAGRLFSEAEWAMMN